MYRKQRSKGRWLVAALLSIAIVVPLIPGIYTRPGPDLFGFPFFYWFQFLLILVGAVFTAIAYFLVSRERHDRRPRVSEEASHRE